MRRQPNLSYHNVVRSVVIVLPGNRYYGRCGNLVTKFLQHTVTRY